MFDESNVSSIRGSRWIRQGPIEAAAAAAAAAAATFM